MARHESELESVTSGLAVLRRETVASHFATSHLDYILRHASSLG